jgi:hypothetical protein
MIALFTMAKLHIYIRPTNTNNTYLQINAKRLQNNTQEKDIHQKIEHAKYATNHFDTI